MSEEGKRTLWGLPIVITDAVPKGEIIIGRFPTWHEVWLHGSFEKAIEAQKRAWAKIKLDDAVPVEDVVE